MTRKLTAGACLLVTALALFEAPAPAHQPEVVSAPRPVRIADPEISRAFYGRLKGKPAIFLIDSKKRFDLYVNILAPAIKSAQTDFEVSVKKKGRREVLFVLEGRDFKWREFYEPFAGDEYLRGPEKRTRLPAGSYVIEVSREKNRGKYVLAVGEKEVFRFNETIKYLASIYRLKTELYGKSPLSIFQGIFGVFMLACLLAIGAGAALFYRAMLKNHS